MLDVLDQACSQWRMTISTGKTKILLVGDRNEHQPPITLQGQVLEDVESSPSWAAAKVEREVAVRLEKASKVYQIWRQNVFRSWNISRSVKVHVFRTMVMFVLLHGAETWPVTQHDVRRLKHFR